MKKTPVAVIGFLRKDVLEATLNNLAKADGVSERDIYVYLSAPRNDADKPKTDAVKRFVENYKQNVLKNITIVLRDKNEGAGKNIRYAVTETLEKTGKAIILEEDILVSKTFLKYMDSALDFYENDARIWCINGYKNPYLCIPNSYRQDVYLNPRNMAWGWGGWIDRWERVDFDLTNWEEYKSSLKNIEKLVAAGMDLPNMVQAQASGKIDTWDVQCSYYMVKNGLYAVEPRYSLTKNIGHGTQDSVHCKSVDPMIQKQKYYNFSPKLTRDIQLDPTLSKRFKCSIQDFTFVGRIKRKLLRLVKKTSKMSNHPLDMTI